MEVRLIERYVRLKGRRILEIGSGYGRLTQQLAPLAAGIVAIEPDPAAVALARRMVSENGFTNVSFHVGSAERVRLGRDRFDLVLFSWSL